MSKECFWCEKKNWGEKYAPFCSKKCKEKFENSPQRKARLAECKKMLKKFKGEKNEQH